MKIVTGVENIMVYFRINVQRFLFSLYKVRNHIQKPTFVNVVLITFYATYALEMKIEKKKCGAMEENNKHCHRNYSF